MISSIVLMAISLTASRMGSTSKSFDHSAWIGVELDAGVLIMTDN
jgi:hypothetical protein